MKGHPQLAFSKAPQAVRSHVFCSITCGSLSPDAVEPAMSKTPKASRKLQHARFFLRQLKLLDAKLIGKDPHEFECYLSACLGALVSAFYRLREEVGHSTFKKKKGQWLMHLSVDKRQFFNHMTKQRDLDVHEVDPETIKKETAIPRSFSTKRPCVRSTRKPRGKSHRRRDANWG